MANNCFEVDFFKKTRRITKGELWEIVETRRRNIKSIRVSDKIIERDKTEYSSHALADVMYGENRNDWILVTRSRIGK